MRMVIDTNILISAFVFGKGMTKQLEIVIATPGIQILRSQKIFEELEETIFHEKFTGIQNEEILESNILNFQMRKR